MKKVLACLLALGLVVGDVPVAQAAEAAATTDAAVVTTGEVISETESETEAVKSEVAEDEEELYGNITVEETAPGVPDYEQFQSKHPVTAGTDKLWTYASSQNWEAMEITFSGDTSAYVEGADESDNFIAVRAQWDDDEEWYSFNQYCYGDGWAGKTITVPGNIVYIETNMSTGGAYGFDVVSVKEGSLDNLSVGTVEVGNTAAGEADLSKFQSKHPADEGTDKTWTYTADADCQGLAVTFSEDTSLFYDEDADYMDSIRVWGDYDEDSEEYTYSRTFYGSELTGNTINIPGKSVSIRLRTYGSTSQGFKVTSVKQISEDDLLEGTVKVKDVSKFQSKHPADAGTAKTWKYTSSEEWDATAVTFSEATELDTENEDYIKVSSGNNFSKYYYGSDLAGKTIVVAGNQVNVSLYTYGNASYGFAVTSIAEGRIEDVTIGPKAIKNDFLKVVTNETGCNFSLGTVGGNPENTKDDNQKMLFGFPGDGTSYVSLKIDGEIDTYGTDTSVTNKGTALCSSSTIDEIQVTQNLELVKNTSTNREDVLKISYTCKNTDTESHQVGCRFMLDTMLGDNDSAPFRVPGVGDVTTYKKFTGDQIPQYWQAFDDLSDPTVISQGSILRDIENRPDEMLLTNYGYACGAAWDENFEEGKENGDSAVVLIWEAKELAPGAEITYTTYYGLSELEQDSSGKLPLSIYGDLYAAQSDYNEETGLPVYDDMTYTAYLNNPTDSTITNAKASIEVPEGFALAPGEEQTQTFAKIEPQEVKQVDWQVQLDPEKVEPGQTYEVKITSSADGDAPKELTRSVTIPGTLVEKTDIAEVATVDPIEAQEYTGSAVEPKVTVKNGDAILKEGTNYTLSYENNTQAGTATVKISGAGMYTGSISKTFTIQSKALSDAGVSLSQQTYTYSGQACTPAVTVKDGEKVLTANTDYTVAYASNVNAGTATVTVTGKGNYTGSINKTFTINPKALVNEGVSLSQQTYTYSGQACAPTVTVKDGEKVLTGNTDYTVSYASNINVGTATVTVTGKGNYTGTITKEFTITPKALTDSDVTLSQEVYTYNGQACIPAVTVKDGDKALAVDTDYTVAYASNTNAGTATVTVTGKGNYTGEVTKQFTIAPKALDSKNIKLTTTKYTYSGKAFTPGAKVSDAGKTLTKDTDYKITYKNNKNVGTATATITGNGNYKGTITKTFQIVLGKVSGGKFSSVKPNSMKLSWKKLAGAKGYEVYQLNGKKWTKIKTTTSTSYTISNLNVGTSYKFKVRAYTKSGSKTFYGSYSSEYKKSTSSKGLTSYGLKTGKKQVTGSWKKFSGAKGYKVYYRAAKTSKWTAVKSSGTSFKKTGLKKGKTYEFMVEAYKTVGSGKNKKTIIIARSKKSIKVK